MIRLIYVDPQSYHGLAKYDVAYLRGLVEAGFDGDIRFYCSCLLDQEAPDGITVRPVFHYNRIRWRPLKLLSYIASVVRILVAGFRSRGGVFHFQWVKFVPVDLLAIVVLRKLTRARVVLTAHNVVPHGEEDGRHRLLGCLYRAVDRIVVHHADTATEVSDRFGVDPGRFRTLRHGLIDLEPKGTPRHEQALRNFAGRYGVRFVFFGRGSRYKGLDILLRAWPRVNAMAQGAAGLVIIGAIDQDLKALAGQAVDRAGGSLLVIDEHVSEADLYVAATTSDAVILPHRKISQSGVLASVLGLEIPVVVSSLPGLREPLEMAAVGWSFDGTENGLVQRLTQIIEDPALLAAAKTDREAWSAVKRAYDWRQIAAQGSAVYGELPGISSSG